MSTKAEPKRYGKPLRNFRAEDEVWDEALRIARARGESLSSVLVASLRRYVARHKDEVDAG